MKKVLEAVLHKKAHQVPPIWFMRQAGRHLPQYHKLKEEHGGNFLALLLSKGFITKATMQPVEQYDLDAAIIFSDILLIPYILGMEIQYEGGARIVQPLDSVTNWAEPDFSKLHELYQGVENTRMQLHQDKSLIGFCPAPWTAFCYMADGRSKNGKFPNALKMLSEQSKFVCKTLHMLAEIVAEHLMLQIRFGADVVQVFDTWAETMPKEFYNGFYTTVLERIRVCTGAIPMIYFGKNVSLNDAVLELFDCISIGSEVSLKTAKAMQKLVCVQGNLSSELAAGKVEDMLAQVRRITDQLRDGPFIFSLGHGVLPHTPVSNLQSLVDEVRSNDPI